MKDTSKKNRFYFTGSFAIIALIKNNTYIIKKGLHD